MICLFLIGIQCQIQDYFTHTKTDSIMAGGNREVLRGNP